jgi:hypothetical protein
VARLVVANGVGVYGENIL